MQEDNIDLQQEAKDLVLSELEKNGVISFMRANIKKSILDIISHEKDNIKQKLDFDFMTPLHRLNKSKEIILVCQLIKEFLKFYEMEYTLPIFENESNVKENIKRETLLKELKLQGKKEDSKPVLLILLMDKLNRQDNIAAGLNANKGASERYDFNNFGSVFNRDDNSTAVIPNKKQLSPISFGSTNKSLDMVNNNNSEPDKFNTFNISDVYKREKSDPAKENSNENKGKEITSADIIGENKTENKLSDELKKDNNEEKPPVKPPSEENKNDLLDDLILEDIDLNGNKPPQEKKEGESQSFSTSNMNSLGADSSVGPKNNNNFDYVEEADKKV